MMIKSAMDTQTVHATHAFVVYQSGGEEPAEYATVHPILSIDGRPQIMPGRLLNDSDLETLRVGLGKTDSGARWIDDQVLCTGPDRMIWYTPPGLRSMFFDSSSHVEPACTGQASLAVPGLVWMAWRGVLHVYATKCAGRPAQDTVLYQAPLFNVWSRGKVCVGSATVPRDEQKWQPQAWEQMMFGSRFTHPNFTQKDRLLIGDPASYWAAQLKKPARKFPINKLVPLPLTAGQLASPDLEKILDSIQKATGEF